MKNLKRRLFIFFVIALFVSAIAISSAAISDSHWAIDYADFCINERLFLEILERSDMTVNDSLLRQDVPLALGQIENATDLFFTQVETGFTDVSVGHPYAGAILWGKENGIVSGVGNDLFAPTTAVTREQLCTFIYRYCNKFSVTLPVVKSMPDFSDAATISSSMLPAVTALCRADVFQGYDDGTFRPKETITVAQASKVFTLLHGLKHNTDSQINLYVKANNGSQITSAACYFYTVNESDMSWTPVYTVSGFARSNTVTGYFGINVLGVHTMAAVPALTAPSKQYVFVTLPADSYDNVPVPGYTPNSKWPHSGCGDSWAFNHNVEETYCGLNYMKSCQNFGWRYLSGAREFHQGIDISGGGLSAKSVIPQELEVIKSTFDPYSMGNYVQLATADGSVYVTYMHLTSRSVFTGDSVNLGDEVGITGNTGGSSLGAHLHLQLSKDSVIGAGTTAEARAAFIDPRAYIN